MRGSGAARRRARVANAAQWSGHHSHRHALVTTSAELNAASNCTRRQPVFSSARCRVVDVPRIKGVPSDITAPNQSCCDQRNATTLAAAAAAVLRGASVHGAQGGTSAPPSTTRVLCRDAEQVVRTHCQVARCLQSSVQFCSHQPGLPTSNVAIKLTHTYSCADTAQLLHRRDSQGSSSQGGW